MSAELALARLEKDVLGVARVSRFLDAVDLLRRMLAMESPEIREKILLLTAPKIGKDLAAAVSAAWNLGILDAEKIVGEGRTPGIPASPPKDLITAARATEKAIADELKKARKLARAGADVTQALAPVLNAANVTRRDVTTLVNHAGNAGTTAVADASGMATVWIAETNACVECLAYSGRTAKPGKEFPGGISYGKRTDSKPITAPPRHPHCRCTVEPLRSKEYAAALRREADRSVLRGFSLESERMSVRVDAADRLLSKVTTKADGTLEVNGHGVPKSVVAYAENAVKRGKFTTRGRP